jgi:hypothetical protein
LNQKIFQRNNASDSIETIPYVRNLQELNKEMNLQNSNLKIDLKEKLKEADERNRSQSAHIHGKIVSLNNEV